MSCGRAEAETLQSPSVSSPRPVQRLKCINTAAHSVLLLNGCPCFFFFEQEESIISLRNFAVSPHILPSRFFLLVFVENKNC